MNSLKELRKDGYTFKHLDGFVLGTHPSKKTIKILEIGLPQENFHICVIEEFGRELEKVMNGKFYLRNSDKNKVNVKKKTGEEK